MYYVYSVQKVNVALRDDHFTVNQKPSFRQQSFRANICSPFPSSLQTKKKLSHFTFLWSSFMIHIFQCLKIESIFSSKISGHCVEKTGVEKIEWNQESMFRQFYWWLVSVYRLLVRNSTRKLVWKSLTWFKIWPDFHQMRPDFVRTLFLTCRPLKALFNAVILNGLQFTTLSANLADLEFLKIE